MHFLMYLLAVALQAPDSGAFVITLGKDTIGMERYTRTADRLVDDMVMRDRAPVISRHFVATLGADGLISHIELDNKPVVASAVFRVDAAGHILGADGRLTTQKVVVTRVPTLDLDAFAAAFGNRPLGQLSPPDSVRVDVAGAHIAVDYGRPAMRGRKIFGDIVPWNTVWRTGGNFATRFTTSADLVMGGTTILKGAYTLWTLPASTGWKLILNKQTKAPCEGEACTLPTRAPLWGTDYAADSDFVRVDANTESLPRDRKSTRLNSSHGYISYAVF